jgi:hypothetical protein
MISRKVVGLMLAATVTFSAPALATSHGAVKMFDSDNDGTLDPAEVQKAATATFAKLERRMAPSTHASCGAG